MIKKIMAGVLVGVLVTLWALQHDQRVQDRVGKAVLHAMQKAFDCTMTGTIRSLDLLTLSLEFENLYAVACNDHWSWHAQTLKLSCSWLDLIAYRLLSLHVDVLGCRADSVIDDTARLGIWEFIDKLRGQSPFSVPIALKSLHIEHSYVAIAHVDQGLRITHHLHGDLKKMGKYFKAVFQAHNMQVIKNNHILLQQGEGAVTFQADATTGDKTVYAGDFRYCLPAYADEICTLAGSWNGSQGLLLAKSASNDWFISVDSFSYIAHKLHASYKAIIPSSLIVRLSGHNDKGSVKGIITTQGTATAYPLQINAACAVKNISYDNRSLVDELAATIVTSPDGGFAGSVSVIKNEASLMSGDWRWHAGQAQLALKNDAECELMNSGWKIKPSGVQGIVSWCDGKPALTIAGLLERLAERKEVGITVTRENTDIKVSGCCGDLSLQGTVVASPLNLSSFIVTSSGRDVLVVKQGKKHGVHATIDLGLVASIGKEFLSAPVQAEGLLHLSAWYYKDKLWGNLAVQQGTLRVPSFHNLIKDVQAKFVLDRQYKTLEMRDIECVLHRGSIISKRAIIGFNNDWKVSYLHLPVEVKNCFFNVTKDFFAMLSGYLVATWKQEQRAHLQGSLFLDKGQLKYNIFSSRLGHHFGSTAGRAMSPSVDVDCNVYINSRDPLRVKTMFLETNAKIALQIKGTLQQPQMLGSIELLSGEFIFPYKPLCITKGSIIFSQHSNEPLLTLHAKNMIKRYNINLHVNGSLYNPHVYIDSSPHLTEEQILALLLVGSEKDSLSLVLPAVIANNLKNLIISADHSFPMLERYMFNFLKPLRYIHVLPSYHDQSGRGGLRGAVEIEVSDRLRAYMQKNFSLTEDIRFELEYTLSDDIRIKGMRDEHGDMGAEVEMRWKF